MAAYFQLWLSSEMAPASSSSPMVTGDRAINPCVPFIIPSRAVRTTGAIIFGKTAGRTGRLPVRSRLTRNKRRIDSCFVVTVYRLRTHQLCSRLGPFVNTGGGCCLNWPRT
jgi:hypothetical protein